MKWIIFKLVFLNFLVCPGIAISQLHEDYSNPAILALSRIIWDEKPGMSTEWLDSCIFSKDFEIRLWAYMAVGVHLESMDTLIDPKTYEFETMLTSKMNAAKRSGEIDQYFFSYMESEKLLNLPERVHSFTSVSDFLQEMVFIRYVKKLRQQRDDLKPSIEKIEPYFTERQRLYMSLAANDKEKLLQKFDSLSKETQVSGIEFFELGEVIKTYRGLFMSRFEKYYTPKHFWKSSAKLKIIILKYWILNLDLVDQNDKIKILHVINSHDLADEWFPVKTSILLLNCLFEDCSQEKYTHKIYELEELKGELLLIQAAAERSQFISDSINQCRKSQDTIQRERIIRPESKVTRFNNRPLDEIEEYIMTNLRVDLYKNPAFFRDTVAINLRKAMELLGNANQNTKDFTTSGNNEEVMTKILIDIGTTDCENCYEESSNHIYRMGDLAIPTLKQEFFSTDKKRSQFASQKLIELKDKEIILWLMSIVAATDDPFIKSSGELMLSIMRSHRKLHIANRGVSESESKMLSAELIDPFLATIKRDK